MSQSTGKTVVIVGGHGNVALHLAKQLSSTHHKVLSIIRDSSHEADITATGASALLVSLENDPKEAFTTLFEGHGADVVVFSAGAGGKGGEERTKRVDYEGAVKIFDAIDGCGEGKRPRLILVSAVDIRDPDKIPAHYVSDLDISAFTIYFPDMTLTIHC
jgi:nucleoside-diphosphate-sugar epimerase